MSLPGSSPLARGLHLIAGLQRRQLRIIPARAGFTLFLSGPRAFCWDHPRSRGVYSRVSCGAAADGGSSPLARGLLFWMRIMGRGKRIIPARAGFTMGHSTLTPQTRDHPRSRGVYWYCTVEGRWGLGSSPLARGLRGDATVSGNSDRIIPARAGFTPRPTRRWDGARDHPRSRGVYSAPLPRLPCVLGSSPLARGLQPHRLDANSSGGIIPARAGFTWTMTALSLLAGDHPRSRGVYRQGEDDRVEVEGSSPLAWGLQVRRHHQRAQRRIIPARAGFTVSPATARTICSDHPRSRGVYLDREVLSRAVSGSSPLARGLRQVHLFVENGCRIIPARAGFT